MIFLQNRKKGAVTKLACIALMCLFALSLFGMNTAQAADTSNCLSCHNGSDTNAPNVGLFNTSGHGRPSANLDCLDCHDSNIPHDGVTRTYFFDAARYAPGYSGVDYAAGYRLKYVNGQVPLMIPTNYNITFAYNAQDMKDNAFRLCFSCHDSSKILDNTPGDNLDTNFKASLPDPPRNYSYAWGSGADVNEHVSHIMNYVGTFADSDWDVGTVGPGGSNGCDTLMTCTNCHNVHGSYGTAGSTNEAMIRDGSLAGRTGYGFSYVIEDVGCGGYPMVTSTGATQSNSVGAIFRNNTANMCGGSMCHGSPAPPAASSYDASGSSWNTYLEYYRRVGYYGPPPPLNQSPVLDPIGNKTGVEGELLQFTITATDPNPYDILTFGASNLPEGATFDPATATFSWTPSYDQSGNYDNIEFYVMDNGDPIEIDAELIDITVGNALDVFFETVYPKGWSMISLPVDLPDKRLNTLFPEAVVAYGYEKGTGYVRVKNDYDLEIGKGYWILLDEEKSYTLTDHPIPSYTYPVSSDGWAMFGGCSSLAQVSSNNCKIGTIYEYVQGIGYQQVTGHLEPGKGYWIFLDKVSGEATISVETLD